MKIRSTSIVIAAGLFAIVMIVAGASAGLPHVARANQADDTTITIHGYTPGVTPFISNVNLTASNTAVFKGAFSSPFTQSQAPSPGRFQAHMPITTLLTGALKTHKPARLPCQSMDCTMDTTNPVTLTYRFVDGSSRQANIMITTAPYDDLCGYKNPTVTAAQNEQH